MWQGGRHTTRLYRKIDCHVTHACANLFGFPVFKMFYLLNKKSDSKSIFTIKSVATRSLKLDLISICFDNFFWVKSTWNTMVALKSRRKNRWNISWQVQCKHHGNLCAMHMATFTKKSRQNISIWDLVSKILSWRI